jgi:transcriptional regulator with XRE-family HTH domain
MPRKELLRERLARIRKFRGLTQQDLSERTGLSRRAIAHYETRGKDIPPDSIVKISTALRVSMDELFGIKSVSRGPIVENPRLFKKMHLVEGLPRHDKKSVMDYIDMVANRRTSRLKRKEVSSIS